KLGIILAYDNPYSEFTFGEYNAPSILEVAQPEDAVIEFNSLSKIFCMTGDRVGFAVGNEKVIDGLAKVKGNIDSGIPPYIQKAAVVALGSYTSPEKPKEVQEIMNEYEKRRDALVKGLKELGIRVEKPEGTFYIWASVRELGMSSMEFAKMAIRQGVMITPGSGFGEYGEGYVRIASTQNLEKIAEAFERLKKGMEEVKQ
ncbi:aminotransferase class I/II-fold pyridoxal phosphate-dependent enzyme, partial [Candidatus Micrarchaeota archaeon]|nr:aminotransferase class I/II-fold pyridoxal phosphate-dependent enzyme [Candidatus Micrarchaeota archaeon]